MYLAWHIAVLCVCLTGCGCTAPGTASYAFMFNADWHIPSPPVGAHWSWPVGAAHDACTVVWRNNTLASPGVQSVAETGSTGTIQAEFNAAKVLSQFRGTLLGATSSTSSSFTANRYLLKCSCPYSHHRLSDDDEFFAVLMGVLIQLCGCWCQYMCRCACLRVSVRACVRACMRAYLCMLSVRLVQIANAM